MYFLFVIRLDVYSNILENGKTCCNMLATTSGQFWIAHHTKFLILLSACLYSYGDEVFHPGWRYTSHTFQVHHASSVRKADDFDDIDRTDISVWIRNNLLAII